VTNIGTVEGTLTLRDEFTGRLKRATSQLDQTGKKWQQTGQKMTAAGSKMAIGLTLPMVAAGAAALKMSSDFSMALTKIETLVGRSRQDVEGYRKAILSLAGETARAPQELADAMFFITSAGLKGADALDALAASAKASALGLGETASVADAATSAMNAYGPATLSATEATNILALAVRAGKLEAAELAPVMGRLLPTAAAMDIAFEDVAGTLAVMSRTGLDAAEASTSLNSIMVTLLKPTKMATDALDSVGLSLSDLREIAKGPGGIIEAMRLLSERFEGNDEALVQVVPNVRALRGVMNVLAQDASIVDDVMGQVASGTDVLGEGMARLAEEPGFQFSQFLQQAKIRLIEMGDTLVPTFKSLIEWGLKIVDMVGRMVAAFDRLPGPVQTTILVLAGIGIALGPVLLIVGNLITLVGVLTTGLGAATAATTAFVTSLGPIAIVGAGVVGALLLMNKAVKDWAAASKSATDDAVESFNQIAAAVGVAKKAIATGKTTVMQAELKRLEDRQKAVNQEIENYTAAIDKLSNTKTGFGGAFGKAEAEGLETARVGLQQAGLEAGNLQTEIDELRWTIAEMPPVVDDTNESTSDLAGTFGDLTDESKELKKAVDKIFWDAHVRQYTKAQAQLKRIRDYFQEIGEAARKVPVDVVSAPIEQAEEALKALRAQEEWRERQIHHIRELLAEEGRDYEELKNLAAKLGIEWGDIVDLIDTAGDSTSKAATATGQWLGLAAQLTSSFSGVSGQVGQITQGIQGAAAAWQAWTGAETFAEGAAAGMQFGQAISGVSQGLGLTQGLGGTSAFGGQMSGDYSEIGAMIGGIFGPIGAVAGLIIGSFIKSGADDAHAIITEAAGEAGAIITMAEGGLAGEIAKTSTAIESTINDLVFQLGGNLESLADAWVHIRENTITVMVAGVEGVFEDMESAVNFAVTQLMASADISGLSTEVAQALASGAATTIDELVANINFAEMVSQFGMSEVEVAFQNLGREFDQMRKKAEELGIGLEKINREEERRLQALRDEITGAPGLSEMQQRQRAAADFNRQIEQMAKELEAELEAIQQQMAVAAVVTGSSTDMFSAAVEGLVGLGQAAGYVGDTTKQSAEQLAATADSLRQRLENLPDLIKPGDIKIKGTGKGKADRESVRDLLDQFWLHAQRLGKMVPGQIVAGAGAFDQGPMSKIAVAIDEINRKWDEAAEKVKKNAEMLAEVNAAREMELQLLKERAIGEVYGNIKDFEDTSTGTARAIKNLADHADQLRDDFLAMAEEFGFGADRIARGLDRIAAAEQERLAALMNQGVANLFGQLAQLVGDQELAMELRQRMETINFMVRMAQLRAEWAVLRAMLIEAEGIRAGEGDLPADVLMGDEAFAWIEEHWDELLAGLVPPLEGLGTVIGNLGTTIDNTQSRIDALMNQIQNWNDLGMSPAERQLAQLNRQFEEMRAEALALGVDLQLVNDAYAVALQNFWDQILDPIRDFRDAMTLSDLSPLTPAARFAEAQQQFQDLAQRALGGDLEALQQITGAAQEYLSAAAGMFGTAGAGYAGIFGAVQDLLAQLLGESMGDGGVRDGAYDFGDPAAGYRNIIGGAQRFLDGRSTSVCDGLRGVADVVDFAGRRQEDKLDQIIDGLADVKDEVRDQTDRVKDSAGFAVAGGGKRHTMPPDVIGGGRYK
jgi:TP901 family phage tail tape measure protein